MPKTLVIGDSHTNVFSNGGLLYSPGAMTIRSLIATQNKFSDLFDSFLQMYSSKGDSLILAVGEIDIRAHIWQALPLLISKGSSVERYFDKMARSLCDTLDKYVDKHGLERIILWGPPPSSCNGSIYHKEFPFVGDMVTRNILTHEYNKAIINTIRNRHNISNKVFFATIFYSLVNFSLQSRDDIFHDGLHLDSNLFSQVCWEICAASLKDSTSCYVDSCFKIFTQMLFELEVIHRPQSKGNCDDRFDCWFISDQNFERSQIYLPFKDGSTLGFHFFREAETIGNSLNYLGLRKCH
jgi:hypothetical protein